MKKTTISRKGFTLIELLVVIAIIATLAAIAIPVSGKMVERAKINEGNNVAKEIALAVETFYTEYDYLPIPSNGDGSPGQPIDTTKNEEFLAILMGKEDTVNPNGTKFFSGKETRKNKGGIVYDGENPTALYDPFGNPYFVLFEDPAEESITLPEAYKGNDGKPKLIRNARCAVYSPGPDQKINNKKDIKSF